MAGLANCQLIIGWEPVDLICPPGDADCVPCIVEADCGTPPPCKWWACVAGRCKTYDSPSGTTCPDGYCNDKTPPECVQCLQNEHCPAGSYCGGRTCARCDDGLKNGDERGVDCGGHCPGCLGDFCGDGSPCRSGYCVDGHCCQGPCTEECSVCGADGTCNFTPKYQPDISPLCEGKKACNGGGLCLLRDGEFCIDPSECISSNCQNGKCAP